MTVTVDQIIKHFGGKGRGAISRTAEALGCCRQYVTIWKKRGYVSGPMADVIELKSNGKFKAIVLREQARESKGKRVH
ncbi:hypothetical protein [Endozoicomonas sp. 2B-B]